jgi:hypothetical protein
MQVLEEWHGQIGLVAMLQIGLPIALVKKGQCIRVYVLALQPTE